MRKSRCPGLIILTQRWRLQPRLILVRNDKAPAPIVYGQTQKGIGIVAWLRWTADPQKTKTREALRDGKRDILEVSWRLPAVYNDQWGLNQSKEWNL